MDYYNAYLIIWLVFAIAYFILFYLHVKDSIFYSGEKFFAMVFGAFVSVCAAAVWPLTIGFVLSYQIYKLAQSKG